MPETAESYEAAQNFSGVTAWLHGFRFRQIVRSAQALAALRCAQAPLNVLEIGCAYGKAFAALDAAMPIRYAGVDTHKGFVARANELHGARGNFRAVAAPAETFVASEAAALGPLDLVFALETLEHMPAEGVKALLGGVAALKPRMFVASVPVEVGPPIVLKNAGSALIGYARHKEYRFADTLWASIYRLDKIPPHKNGHRGFDWRRIRDDMRGAFGDVRERRFPFGWAPSWMATSVYLEARLRD